MKYASIINIIMYCVLKTGLESIVYIDLKFGIYCFDMKA